MRITEIKRHLDGRVQAFECDLVYAAPSVRVVRFQHPAEARLAGFHFPPGTYTYGFFWRGRHYGLYRIMDPDGRLIAHRFDVIDAVRLRQASVEYLDLALDLWVSPQGRLVLEDAEEVRLYVRRGVLSPERALLVERTRRLLERRHPAIIAEAARLLRLR